MVVLLHDWVPRWIEETTTFKIAAGGRISGKTFGVSQAAVILASGVWKNPYRRPPVRFLVVRQVDLTLDDSIKRELEMRVAEFGQRAQWEFRRRSMIHTPTGSCFNFRGISDRNAESIKGYSGYDVCLCDESQQISDLAWRYLVPTILRKPGAQIWCVHNRTRAWDPVDRELIQRERSNVMIEWINFTRNTMLSDEAKLEIEDFRLREPEKFAHVYLGELESSSTSPQVLSPDMVAACMAAECPESVDGVGDLGLDLASEGGDRSALVLRRGPIVELMETWGQASDAESYAKMFNVAVDRGAMRCYYDPGGVGANVGARHREAVRKWVREERADRLYYPVGVIPVAAGGAVAGKRVRYIQRILNPEYFEYRNAQLAMLLRIRAQNTVRLLEGAEVSPLKCLFLPRQMSAQAKNAMMMELTQPVFKTSLKSKTRLIKSPRPSDPSPDRFDSLALAFARDSERGIRLSQWN